MKILILGGTSEARQLARLLLAKGHEVTTALAGRTQAPIRPEGGLRIGSFGGIDGLCAYLRAEGVDYLIDATHPYAAQMSGNAVAAAAASGVPLIRYLRPPWQAEPGQAWIEAASAEKAAQALPGGARVLLTTGHEGLDHYRARPDCRFLVRVIEAPDLALPAHMELIRSRPPYRLEAELALLGDHGITHLVSKNSGGSQTRAKLVAAHEAGVAVIMIARPIYAPAPEAESVEGVLAALEAASP